jgi:hypothetical protein
MNFIICGLDRLGKSTLINSIKNAKGFFTVIHRQKPEELQYYGNDALLKYQLACFNSDMRMLLAAEEYNIPIIFDRAWLGEAVYSGLYRNYNGNYVFDLELSNNIDRLTNTRLILLTEDFAHSKHFVDDGESFDITKREQEQQLFIDAFNKSTIANKKIICVTDPVTGQFRNKEDILKEALFN